jgi:hypothetical protein
MSYTDTLDRIEKRGKQKFEAEPLTVTRPKPKATPNKGLDARAKREQEQVALQRQRPAWQQAIDVAMPGPQYRVPLKTGLELWAAGPEPFSPKKAITSIASGVSKATGITPVLERIMKISEQKAFEKGKIRPEFLQYQEPHPLALPPEEKYAGWETAGELGGMMLPISGLYGTAGKYAAGLIPKAATGLAAKLGRSALPGAVSGGIYGGGLAALEDKSPQEIAKQAALDAVLFGVGDVALGALGKAAMAAYARMKMPKVELPIPETVTPLAQHRRPNIALPALPGEGKKYRAAWKPGPTAKSIPIGGKQVIKPYEPLPAEVPKAELPIVPSKIVKPKPILSKESLGKINSYKKTLAVLDDEVKNHRERIIAEARSLNPKISEEEALDLHYRKVFLGTVLKKGETSWRSKLAKLAKEQEELTSRWKVKVEPKQVKEKVAVIPEKTLAKEVPVPKEKPVSKIKPYKPLPAEVPKMEKPKAELPKKPPDEIKGEIKTIGGMSQKEMPKFNTWAEKLAVLDEEVKTHRERLIEAERFWNPAITEEKALDLHYQKAFSTGSRAVLKKGETWRSKVVRAAEAEAAKAMPGYIPPKAEAEKIVPSKMEKPKAVKEKATVMPEKTLAKMADEELQVTRNNLPKYKNDMTSEQVKIADDIYKEQLKRYKNKVTEYNKEAEKATGLKHGDKVSKTMPGLGIGVEEYTGKIIYDKNGRLAIKTNMPDGSGRKIFPINKGWTKIEKPPTEKVSQEVKVKPKSVKEVPSGKKEITQPTEIPKKPVSKEEFQEKMLAAQEKRKLLEAEKVTSEKTKTPEDWEKILELEGLGEIKEIPSGSAKEVLEAKTVPKKKFTDDIEKRIAEEAAASEKTLKAYKLEDILKVDDTPEGPAMLYSGIPPEKVVESIKFATTKLADKLGIPSKEITIIKPEAARHPGLITQIKSPTQVAKKYTELKPTVDDGIMSQNIQERLRSIFDKRLNVIDKILNEGKAYIANKQTLHEILLTGDMLGKKFNPSELKQNFEANDAVIKAYQLTRLAYDHAHSIASRTRELRGKMPVNYREGYIPHYFHNWFIIVNGQVAGSAKTLREAVLRSNPLARQKGVKITIVPKQFEFPGGDVQAAVIGDMNYFKLKSNVSKAFSLSHEEAKELLSNVARMKGRSRFVGNFLQRKGTPGWENNLDWVNRHYFNMISRYAALDGFKARNITRFEKQFGAFDKEYKGIAKYIKEYINDVNGNPTAVEELLNSSIAKVPLVNQFFGKYLGSRPSLQIASATTNAVAVAKLGLYNLSPALINTSQLLNTNALLGAKWTAIGIKKAISPSLAERGILKQIGVDIQLGLESGAGYSKAAQIGKGFNKTLVLFLTAEKFLRRTTGLGSYYKALAEGKTRKQAIEYAKETIQRTQFEYGIADAPAFIRRTGPVGQVLFQFKKFPVKELEFMSSLKGMEHVRFWMPWLLVSGYYGIPLVEPMKNTVKSLFNIDLESELKKHLMEWAGEDKERQTAAKTIMYGISHKAGIDASRRIGAGDFVPGELRDITGPTISTIVRTAQMAAKGNWIETIRAIAPMPGNIALAAFNEGEITDPWNRERVKIRLKPKERAVKATGFMPIRESIERDVKSVIGYTERKRQETEKQVIDDFIKTMKKYKTASPGEEKTQALKELKEEAVRLRELNITPERIVNEIKKKKMTPIQRAITNVPRKQQKEYVDILKFAKST